MNNIAAMNDRASDKAWDAQVDFHDALDRFDFRDIIVVDAVCDALRDLAENPAWMEAQYTQQTAIGAIVRNAVNDRVRDLMADGEL